MSANYLPDVLETTEAERLATGFTFTEGPLWHPDGFYYFVDLRQNKLYRITPGQKPELVRETQEGNGTTFDLQGRVIHCEHKLRGVSRMSAGGEVEVIAERYNGARFNKPNDVVCRSDGTLFFTDPEKRVPYKEREVATPEDNLWDGSAVYRIAPDGSIHQVALCEYPNGLAFSPDERTLYVANTRSSKYIHALEIDAAGKMAIDPAFPTASRSTARAACTARGRAACGCSRLTGKKSA
jgi:gluconolactonase